MRNVSMIIALVICLISGACKNSNFHTDCKNITINAQVDSLLQIFIDENQKIDLQYFIVTYLSCGQRIVTLIANNIGDNYYLRKQSLVYFIRNDRKIYLISGIEDLFKKESEMVIKKGNGVTIPLIMIRSYVIDKNKIEFIPRGIPPFAPPPEKPSI